MNTLKYRPHPWLLPGTALLLMAGILIGRESLSWISFLAAMAVTVPVLLGFRRFSAACLALALLAGGALGQIAYHPDLPEEGSYQVSGIVCDEIYTRTDSAQIHTMLTHLRLNGQPYGGSAYWSFYASPAP